MKKILLIVFFLLSVYCFSQTKDEWKSVLIENTYSFKLPASMEVRKDGGFVDLGAKYISKILYNYVYDSNRITLQQKGLDKGTYNSISLYARILILTTKGETGDFPLIESLDIEDIDYMKHFLVESITKDAKKYNIEIINISPVSIKKINGKLAFYLSYSRKSMTNGNPPVFVESYLFWNNDKSIEITLSYRQSEKDIWSFDFNKFINSFTLL